MNHKTRCPHARPLRTAAIVASFALLAACAGAPAKNDAPASGELLRNSLPIAAAALAAGQLDVARRLYLSLAERFKDAPEPALGLGYVEFYNGDFLSAQRNFLQAADLTDDKPAVKAEALLGAGRAALARGKTPEARQILRNAREPGRDAPSAPWIANGLAVAAALDTDYEAAAAHYADAIRLSSGDPRITANYVRMLIAAGRIDDAARLHAAHDSSYWVDEDDRTLSRLMEESRRGRHARSAASPRATESSTVPEVPGTRADAPPETARVDPPPEATGDGPGRRLALRLAEFDPPPAGSSGREEAAERIASSGLVLRLTDWPEAPMPSAADSEAPETVLNVPSTSPIAGPASIAPAPAGDPTDANRLTQASAFPDLEESGFDIPDQSPPTTLTLTIGQSRRLPIEFNATAVSVASPEIADVQLLSPNVLYVIGKSIGRTSVAVLVGDQWSEERIVSVELDLEPLRAALAGVPGLGGVGVRPLARGLALTGEVASAEAADRALRVAAAALPEGVPIENELRVGGPQQVNLEVQIAEVQRSVTEDLGVNWEALRMRGDNSFGFRIGRLGVPDLSFPAIVEGRASPGLFFGKQAANTRIGAMIDALATAGLANVLARPNVTAVSGESASFFSGGEFPLPAGLKDGTLIFEYKKYGVLLDFVPTVVDADRIVLKVRPEVSEPSLNQSVTVAAGIAVPVINVRRAETTVEVGDGESIVIAGLFRNRSNTVESGVPGLKDVPLLGALFGHTSTRSDELELIVIVTARLVRANAAPDIGDTIASAAGRQASGYHY